MNETPLLVTYPHPQCVRVLLQAGADPNVKNIRNRTPLHHTVNYHFDWAVESVRLLLKAGANVNAVEIEGGTPLMWATSGRQVEIVRMLLAAGADVNARDRKGQTALVRLGPVRYRTGHWLPDFLDDLFNRQWRLDRETVEKILQAAGGVQAP